MYHLHFHLALALVLGQSAFSSSSPYKRSSDQYELKDRLGAVASESSVCSKIGVDLIKDGGNAADAVCLKELRKSHSKLANRNNVHSQLVGTVFCVGVIGMYHSGLGGGGFMIVRGSNGSYEFIDFREKAPAAAFTDMYNNDTDLSLFGGLASGVPGELRGTEYLHKHYGKLPWAHVMRPAINLARNGFIVTQDLVNYENEAIAGGPNFLAENPEFSIDFAPNGVLLGLNETITRQRYADTLETISKRGADAFYTGPIANATIQALRASNGTMTLEDLKNYTVAIRKPAQITYRNYKLTACSAPSSGTVALSIMKTIEGYGDIGEASAINLSTHRLDEAMRFAYGEVSNSAFLSVLYQIRNEECHTDLNSEPIWVILYTIQASTNTN